MIRYADILRKGKDELIEELLDKDMEISQLKKELKFYRNQHVKKKGEKS